MERKPPASIGDFIGILRRRKYWIILPFVVVAALGIGLTPLVPRTYKSTTTIMVQAQNISAAYVRPPSTSDMVNHVRRIQLGVMTGPDLLKLIRDLDLYPKLRKRVPIERIPLAMEHDITLGAAPDSGGDDGKLSAFTISYIGRTPREAQQVTGTLANLFIQESLKEGHGQAMQAVEFLNSQVAQAAQQLTAQQAKIQAFKLAHFGSLPEQAQANLQVISQYRNELQTNSAAIDQDNQQLVYLRSVLNVSPKSGPAAAATVPVAPTPLQLELAQKQVELRADLLKFTPQHPDVIRLKREIATLQMQIAHAPKAAALPVISATSQYTGPSQTDLLRGQLIALDTEIKNRYARQTQIQAKIDQLQSSAASAPALQTQFSSLDGQYQEMRKSYDSLVEQRQKAEMAAALYRSDNSEQLVVIQPANLPKAPYRPNPILLYMASVLIAALVGLVCGAIVELRDDTMHNADEVAAYLKLPVMVALPKFAP